MIERPRACKLTEDILVGERICLPYTITNEDLIKFAEISGDWNPIHFDEEFASKSLFGRRISHGLISLAKFSGIFGMYLPGLGTLWETQTVRFLKPVYVDVKYFAIAEVTSKDERKVTISTWVEDVDGQHVIEGTAIVRPITRAALNRVPEHLK